MFTPEEEANAINSVMERLTVSLPQVPPAEVQRVVHLFYVQFIGNPIRDLCPFCWSGWPATTCAPS